MQPAPIQWADRCPLIQGRKFIPRRACKTLKLNPRTRQHTPLDRLHARRPLPFCLATETRPHRLDPMERKPPFAPARRAVIAFFDSVVHRRGQPCNRGGGASSQRETQSQVSDSMERLQARPPVTAIPSYLETLAGTTDRMAEREGARWPWVSQSADAITATMRFLR
jgi:hypothetical protein